VPAQDGGQPRRRAHADELDLRPGQQRAADGVHQLRHPVPGTRDLILKDAAAATGDDKATLEAVANSPLVYPSAAEMAKLRSYVSSPTGR